MDETCSIDDYTIKLDDLTGKQLSVHLFSNVQNIEEIHEKLMTKELACCIIKAQLVLDPFQIAVAANKAALNEKYKQLITRTLYTEVIYCLSTSKNISQSLTTFGISNEVKDIVVVQIYDTSEKKALEKLIDSVKGQRVPVSKLPEFSNVDLIKKTYKIDNEELKVSSLLDSVVSRISDKISK
ncbi:EKC/KEOPS complex subunit Tprkb [Copidosoma floridanum]|uniref:EKC/KEOPS complex subunit Tprkb n=1 Tax=Copidosoma floridanum TaxID=29053 RepID=UPI0006C95A81|nr:EKC/KEOPS complex subunit Tprkb [Copidosoma floridanum]